MHKPIRFALIGCGHIATEHVTQITRVGQLVAVVDTVLAKAKLLGDTNGVPFYESTSALYASVPKIDVVVIATPNGLHATQAIEAMQAGYHVLVEKPMALSAADIEQMKAVAEETGKQIFSVMQNRFNPPVKIIHQLLQQNALGAIQRVQVNCFWHRPAAYYINSWHGTKVLDGGTLFTQFSHFIDLLCWLFGPVKKVNAQLNNRMHQGLIEFEDEGDVDIEFFTGVQANIKYSVNEPFANREGSLTIFSSKGMVSACGAYLNQFDFDLNDALLEAELQQQKGSINQANSVANQYGTYQGSMRNHFHVYDSLQNSLLHQTPYYTTVEEAKHTIDLINLIYQAR
ncbi:MAG: Gfo/Idh/MocA family oxidoreductase [Sediminibacterium sp.]|nr:Gfo/Idh/MocA family oxidoreductase [Sediminibacterium sp.]